MSLSEEHEEKLLEGVARYRSKNHDLILYHEGAKIDVYEPPMVVSLYALSDAFIRQGDAAKILEGWTEREVPGAAMHLTPGYVDELNLSQVAYDMIAGAQSQVAGIEHTGRDEIRGVVEFGAKVDRAMNIVSIDLGRMAIDLKRRREEDERASIPQIVRELLRLAIDRNDNGSLWMRPPTDAERALLRRAVGS